MTAISYHDTVKVLQGLPFVGGGPFARPEWFSLLEAAGHRPFVALARRGDKALALPLTRAADGLEALTNWYAFTWVPLATPGAETLIEELVRDIGTRSHRIVLARLPDEDGTATLLERAFRRAGWTVSREICDTNHILDVEGRDFARYLASRPGQVRTTLRRKAPKVETQIAVRFERADWQAYEDTYARSWKPAEGDPALLGAFAAAEGDAGRLRLGIARHEGQVVAAQFWTVEDGTAYIHKLTHLESARHLSPGTVLTAAMLEQVIDRDAVKRVDFGTGDDPYKRDWMEHARPRFRLVCWRPGVPRNWPGMVRAAVRKLVSPLHHR